MLKIGWFGVVRGHPRSLKIAPFDFWRRKTRVSGLSCGVVSVIVGLAIFVQLRLVTDGRTDRHTMTANIALA